MGKIYSKIVKLFPISRVSFIDTLSYFTLKDVVVGELVHIPLRNKFVPAIVLEVAKVDVSKQGVRQASYKLRKLDKVSGKLVLRSALVGVCTQLASENILSLGKLVSVFTPRLIHLLPNVRDDQVDNLMHIRNEKVPVNLVYGEQDRLDEALDVIVSDAVNSGQSIHIVCANTNSHLRNFSTLYSISYIYIFILLN